MWLLARRDAVGADHGFIEGENVLHIFFIHAEVDRTGWLQARGRLDLADTPLGGDVVEVASGVFGMRLAGGNQHAPLQAIWVGMQHGRTGVVGVAVQGNALALHRLANDRQGNCRFAEVLPTLQLVVGDHHRAVQFSTDMKTLLQ
ncbi:hypothetical protein D3C84_934000 [compost metagenome]